jgi:hypothetical protein
MKAKILTIFCTIHFTLCTLNSAAQERFIRILPDSTWSQYMLAIHEYQDSIVCLNSYPVFDTLPVTPVTGYTFQCKYYKFDKNNIHNPYRLKTYVIDSATNQPEPFCVIKKTQSLIHAGSIFKSNPADTIFGQNVAAYIREIGYSSLDSIASKIIDPIANAQVRRVFKKKNRIYVSFLNGLLPPNFYNTYSAPCYTLACYDTSFNLIWQKSDYITPHNNNFQSSDIIEAPNNQLILGGTETWNYWDGILPNGQPNYQNELYANGYIWKLDSLGNRLWSKMLPYRDSTVSREPLLKALPDSTFLAIYTETFNNYGNQEVSDSADIKVAKYDFDGNLIWCKRLSNEFRTFFQIPITQNVFVMWNTQLLDLADNKLLLLTNNNAAAWLLKMDYDANIEWVRKIEADTVCLLGNTYVYDVDIAADNSFYMCGNIERFPSECSTVNNYSKTGFVMHVDKFGCLEPNCQLTDGIPKLSFESEIVLYPNPTTDEINISYGGVFDTGKPITITISNYTGQVVFTKQYTTTYATINVSDFTNGLYVVTLAQEGKQSVNRKVVKR